MHNLEIVWPTGRAIYTANDSPILVGRSSSADVPLKQGSVSRRHLEIVWEQDAWTVSDPSTHGTFDPIGVKLSKEWIVTSGTMVKVGGTEGVEMNFNLIKTDPVEPWDTSTGSWDQIPADQSGISSAAAPQPISDEEVSVGDVQLSNQRPASPLADGNGYHFGQSVAKPEITAADSTYKPQAVPGQHFRNAQQLDNNSSQNGLPTSGEAFSPLEPATPDPILREQVPNEPLLEEQPPLVRPILSQRLTPSIPESPMNGGEDEPLEFGDRQAPLPELSPDALSQSSVTSDRPSANVSEAILRLSVDGQDYSFSPGTEITVGRDPSCLIHLDERHSLVSRQHLRITHDEGSWWLEDHSSKGTFVDDKLVKGQYRAEGAFITHLGDRDSGTQVRVITAGTHHVQKKRSWALPAIGVGIALVAIAAIGYFLLFGRGSEEAAVPVDPATAQASTVMLVTIEEGRVASSSSGFMVANDLIVTTRSVTNGNTVSLVGVVNQADEPAIVTYATSWVASHPYLDLAVLRVTSNTVETDGGYVMTADVEDNIGLPLLSLGQSSDAIAGDEIYVSGFPASPDIASNGKGGLELPHSESTSGTLGNFRMWPGCDSPNWQDSLPTEATSGSNCSDDGNIEQALLTMEMPNGSAGPGSPVIREGKVVAVVLGEDRQDFSTVHAMASESFTDWLGKITDANS